MNEDEVESRPELDQQALDLSSGRFSESSPERFRHLKVLLLSGAPLATEDLAKVLMWAPSLWKLHASYCSSSIHFDYIQLTAGLAALPELELWQRMSNIKSLLLHKNLLAKWQDVECAASPGNLEWLTLYGNPITSQPEYQTHVLSVATTLIALDLRVLTDEEHLAVTETGAERRPAGNATGSFRRFAANSEASAFLFREKPPESFLPPQELLREAADELRQLYGKSAQCSAAFAIQGGWRVYKARSLKFSLSETQRISAIRLQKCARKFLWKRAMQTYVEKFLAEEEGLDLLLSAQEMLTLRASKLIELSVRRWVRRRKNRRTVREAATIIARNVKGHLTRCKLLRKFLKLDTYRRIYFPASCTWEAIVLLNVARAACDLSPLPREHQFEAADVMAIRMVDSSEMPRSKSEVSRLLAFRNFSLLRPCHSRRYPSHLWDGPFHRLVPGGTPQRFLEAYGRVRRRAANVDNICRKVFLASCACGPHPIVRDAPYEEGPFVVRETKAPDFRELYTFGRLLGEGDFGIVYTCDVKLGGSAWDEELTREAEARQRAEDTAKDAEATSDGKALSLPQLLHERRKQQLQQMEQRLQCRRHEPSKPDIPASGLVVKMVDHASSWWGNLAHSLQKSHQGKSWLLLSQEVKKLSQLSHINLIKTHTVFVDDYFVYFVISRFPCSLRDAVLTTGKFSRRGLPVSIAAYTADQLLSALAYLHAHNVAHRGITPDNLVVTTSNILNERFTLVIADLYSTARSVEAGAFLTEVFGSPEYWAPEVAECEYSFAADVWAAGVVLWFAQTKKLPFTSLQNVLTRDVEPNVRITRDVFESLASMLCREVENRITAEEALKHDWLRESEFGPSQIQTRRGAAVNRHGSTSGVPGLHGLLLQGMVEPRESDYITVPMPSLEHQAQEQYGEVKDPALLASRGTLRWAELRFKNVEQARRRAAILFLCSWSALHREAVPFVPKSMIQNVEVGAAVLRFWKVYGLTWAVGEKTSSHKLRNLALKHSSNAVSLNGREPWSFVMRQEWLGMDRTGPSLSEKPMTVKEVFAGNKWGVSSSGLTGTGSPIPLRGARGTYRAGNTMLPPLPPTRPNSASARSEYRTPTSYSTASPVSLSSSRASPRAAQLLNFEAQKLWGDAVQDALARTPTSMPPLTPRSSRGRTPRAATAKSEASPRKTDIQSPRH